MIKASSASKQGFSLIEVIIAMAILVMVISVVGTGLIGVLNMETDTSLQQEVVSIGQWVNARRLEGASADEIRLELRDRWPDAQLVVSIRHDEDDREWELWRIANLRGGGDLVLEIPITLAPPS